jgi:hypothetical protein
MEIRIMTTRLVLACTFACVSAFPSISSAQLHLGDIILEVEQGAIATWREEGGSIAYPWAVFASILGEGGIPNAALEPGFDSEPQTFSPNALVGLTVRRALRAWDGSAFTTIPPLSLRITKNTASVTTPATDPANCNAGSLILGAATSNGRLHQHAGFELLAPAATGLYLLEFELWIGSSTSGVSHPVYLIFNQNQPMAEFESAVQWAEARYARPCYANCDLSTVAPTLNVGDFTCFLQKFAAGDCLANCDRSTSAPVLNVGDFTCFLQRFASGCP